MTQLEHLVQELLIDLYGPSAVVFRNDIQVRELEGLPLNKGVVHAAIPEEH